MPCHFVALIVRLIRLYDGGFVPHAINGADKAVRPKTGIGVPRSRSNLCEIGRPFCGVHLTVLFGLPRAYPLRVSLGEDKTGTGKPLSRAKLRPRFDPIIVKLSNPTANVAPGQGLLRGVLGAKFQPDVAWYRESVLLIKDQRAPRENRLCELGGYNRSQECDWKQANSLDLSPAGM
jgi:hypothetical protein